MHFWEPATAGELDRLHAGATRLLAQVGMRIQHPRAVEVLAGAGAHVVDGNVVRFPSALIESAIASAPATFPVYDRRGGSYVIGGPAHYHLAGGTMTDLLDFPGWTRRPATLADCAAFTRLTDALDAVDFSCLSLEAQDQPLGAGEIRSIAALMQNTTKFVMACPVRARANEAFVAMAKALAGTDDLSARPTIGLLATMVPGFEIDHEGAEALLIAGREGLPIILMGGGIMGAQGPATMAGNFVTQVAEELAALVLVQAVRPGSPCLLNWGDMKLDMRTTQGEFAGPEFHLAMGVGAQLSRRYGIPSYTCPASDSKIGDLQAGFEFADGVQVSNLAGIHVTVNAGTASLCSAGSYELLVLHNEMLRSIKRVREGMRIDDETLCIDLQVEAGLRHDYLTNPHTVRYIRDRQEFMHKDLFDVTGSAGTYEDPMIRAGARARRLLAEHQPAVTPAECAAVDAVAEAYLR